MLAVALLLGLAVQMEDWTWMAKRRQKRARPLLKEESVVQQ